MEEKIRITRGSVQETLIIPLYARKMCCEKFPSLYINFGRKPIDLQSMG